MSQVTQSHDIEKNIKCSVLKNVIQYDVRCGLHWEWKSAKWTQRYIDLWNDLDFSLCAMLSVCYVVTTLDRRKKSEMEVSTDWCIAIEH